MTTITVEVPHKMAKDMWSTISLDRLMDYMIDEGKYGLFFDEIEEDNLSTATQQMIIESEQANVIFTSVKDR